jgi:hypothetical protein
MTGLSEDEYCALREMCSSTGARSISDITRDAMRALLGGSAREQSLDGYMGQLRAQIVSLDEKIDRLAERVASSRIEAKE